MHGYLAISQSSPNPNVYIFESHYMQFKYMCMFTHTHTTILYVKKTCRHLCSWKLRTASGICWDVMWLGPPISLCLIFCLRVVWMCSSLSWFCKPILFQSIFQNSSYFLEGSNGLWGDSMRELVRELKNYFVKRKVGWKRIKWSSNGWM